MKPCPDCQKWKADYVLQGSDNSIVHLCKCGEEDKMASVKCSTCGGSRFSWYTGNGSAVLPQCTCPKETVSEDVPQVTHTFSEGWACPKCGRVWAPDVKGCEVCNDLALASGTTYPMPKPDKIYADGVVYYTTCLLYTSPSPRDRS